MDNFAKVINEVGLVPKFFVAVCENNDDPLHRGRVQVRVIGLHTEVKNEYKLEGILTEHLPWASPILSVGGGSITGRGVWPDAPEQGSLLMVFFLDGNEYQQPFYLGTIAGSRLLKSNSEIGFNDPTELWPRTDRIPNNEDSTGYGDSPFHSDESRKVLGETYLDVIKDDIEKTNNESIISAYGIDRWNETGPSSQPDKKYNWTEEHHPFDYKSSDAHDRHGYIKEIDSTPNHEGIREYFPRSASYKQISGSGHEKQRLVGGREHVVFENDRLQVKGFQNIVVEGERYILVQEDVFNEFKRDLNEKMENMTQEISSLKHVTAENIVHKVAGTHKLSDDNNTSNVCDRQICPFDGNPHFLQVKVKV